MTYAKKPNDLVDYLGDVYYNVPSANWFIWKLLRSINLRTNQATIDTSVMNNTERVMVDTAYQILHKDNFVIRTKEGNYLFNPNIILPEEEDDWNESGILWLSLGGKL